ncbi:hypothetical protein TREMEDRAFT_68502 [Tremella mesenterica DSM 1558]|uniref:uncharacterized protein n=1 Tax=Tremella mesenterica (strain ATCC 24925 / CBS 8224 / DSM 1558 / NBRC 9311 / NRRL Y-6157 / RJB 2259-6 / UBC 559-6) TaxID=578456 RepID=UPI0003F4A555|nr:uncharacterized protein TREMEDRAFT_68502 [Tremella mesenterica DSM 1558]EIW70127.1 hypothetical protein TREMEDRAFT_68502 [Tremella mesenterica DSM 1558]
METQPQDDLHTLDESLRHLRLDIPHQPLRLDKMFLRASQWRQHSQVPTTPRPPSPVRKHKVYPLPRPQQGVSPLGGLFDYTELIPCILDGFEHPREWTVLARINRTVGELARKSLYEHVWVRPWEADPHTKLVKLFETFHHNPELCTLVKKLDVRFFPLGLRNEQRHDLDEKVRMALSRMINLEYLTWTRDKSLNPELLQTIVLLPQLRSLEISGHSWRYYDPSLIGLEELGVEALSHSGLTDMSHFPPLPFLHTLSISISPSKPLSSPTTTSNSFPISTFTSHKPIPPPSLPFPHLPPVPSLQSLHITYSNSQIPLLPHSIPFLSCQLSPRNLLKLSLLNFILSSDTLSLLLQEFCNLEELYITLPSFEPVHQCFDLLSQSNLKVLHINLPDRGSEVEELEGLVERMKWLEEVGMGNRVYEVVRTYEEGMKKVELVRWGKTSIPRYFQIWRG